MRSLLLDRWSWPSPSRRTAPPRPRRPSSRDTGRAERAERGARAGVPKLKITRVVRHVDHPWDVQSLRAGPLLFTQRDRATLSVLKKGKVRRIGFPRRQVWVSGETGLMGLAVDPDSPPTGASTPARAGSPAAGTTSG